MRDLTESIYQHILIYVKRDDLLAAQVGLFAALADPTRLQILSLLQAKGPMHVTEIYETLDRRQNLVSHHLNCLRTCGLVTVEKQGRLAIYALAHPEIARMLDWAEKRVLDQAERILSCRIVGKRQGNDRPSRKR